MTVLIIISARTCFLKGNCVNIAMYPRGHEYIASKGCSFSGLQLLSQIKLKEIKMTYLHVSLEQSNLEQQELDRIHKEESLNTDLYSGGFFDGLIGLEPSKPEQHSYWLGYQTGYREYWAAKLSVEIPSKF